MNCELLSGLIFWAIVIIILAVLISETIITTKGLKIPTYLNFIKPIIQPLGYVFLVA
jgi:hypothetical protein